MAANLIPFSNDSYSVRVIDRDGSPWFVAKDVCAALDLTNSSQALSRLDREEKGVILTDTLGGRQRVAVISESGLYALILRSDKPAARPFRRWVTGEVLPAIRRTGRYSAAVPASGSVGVPEVAPVAAITADEALDRLLAWLDVELLDGVMMVGTHDALRRVVQRGRQMQALIGVVPRPVPAVPSVYGPQPPNVYGSLPMETAPMISAAQAVDRLLAWLEVELLDGVMLAGTHDALRRVVQRGRQMQALIVGTPDPALARSKQPGAVAVPARRVGRDVKEDSTALAIQDFLACCFVMTGDHRDRIRVRDVVATYRDWARSTGRVCQPDRVVMIALARQAEVYRDAGTGFGFVRFKASVKTMAGLRRR